LRTIGTMRVGNGNLESVESSTGKLCGLLAILAPSGSFLSMWIANRRLAQIAVIFGCIGMTGPASAWGPPPDSGQPRQFAPDQGWKRLFNGADLSGWTFRNPAAKKVWVVCDEVRLDPSDPARLLPVGKGGAAES